MGEVCNCEGDGGDGICCCCDKGSETRVVSVAGFIVGDLGGGGSKIGSGFQRFWKRLEWV